MGKIDEAFQNVRRAYFVPEDFIVDADFDIPLPIGYEQTISQPTTVRLMLEWLDAQPGEKILDIGSGSGWTAALLSDIVGPKGSVFAVEIIPELLEFGRNNCENFGIENAKFFLANKKSLGLPKYAPYDRILVSASAQELPLELLDQLKISGKLVIPVKSSIMEVTKKSESDYDSIVHPGFVFVPLV